MPESLSYYQRKFETLRIDRTHGEPAPNKPILLLAVIDLIEQGAIKENKIYPSPLLVETFLKYWHLVRDGNPRIHYPFKYLRTDKFWHLKIKPGMHENLFGRREFASFSQLAETIEYASLDEDLFVYLQYLATREVLRYTLIQTYFIKHSEVFRTAIDDSREIHSIENILLESAEKNDFSLLNEITDEKKRDRAFSKTIMRLYDYACAACHYRIITENGEACVDAAHIFPFSDSKDDSIGNGISLCKLHHWAFDKGLFSINDNYKIVVAKSFTESGNENFSLHILQSKTVLLPKEKPFRPSISMLRWHRENKFNS
jgi:putative restriction endonuclease